MPLPDAELEADGDVQGLEKKEEEEEAESVAKRAIRRLLSSSASLKACTMPRDRGGGGVLVTTAGIGSGRNLFERDKTNCECLSEKVDPFGMVLSNCGTGHGRRS